MSEELPPGWTTALLGEFSDINPKHPKGLNEALPVSFVPMAGVSETKPGFEFTEERPLGAVRKGFTHFSEGDVLFAKITPCMENGKGAVARGLTNNLGCGTTELHVVRPRGGVSPDYIYRFLSQPAIRRKAKSKFTGSAGQARVPTSFIEELEVPVAPLPEQQRIVAKLETLLSKVDASSKRLEHTPVLLKRFRQAVLVSACSGPLTADWRRESPALGTADQLRDGDPPEGIWIPDTWSWIRAGHVFGSVTSGSRGWARYYANDGPLFLRVGNLDHDSIQLDLRSVQHVRPPSNAEGVRTRIRPGDVLISITADVGMVALVQTEIGEAYINQHVALARPNGMLDSHYLAYFLAAKNGGQEQFHNLQRGATKVGLGLDDIRSIWIARPPIPEQQEIVRRVEALFAVADQVEARYEKARTLVDKLAPSLLAKAFRGELVAQDPNDEPASALLERIRAAPRKRVAEQHKGGLRDMARRTNGRQRTGKPRSLDEILLENGKPLTPEELLDQAGFAESSVDAFYEQLRALVRIARIRENRPNQKDVTLEAIGP